MGWENGAGVSQQNASTITALVPRKPKAGSLEREVKHYKIQKSSRNSFISLEILGIDQHLLSGIIVNKRRRFSWQKRKTGSKAKWGYNFKELTPLSNTAERNKRIELSLLL